MLKVLFFSMFALGLLVSFACGLATFMAWPDTNTTTSVIAYLLAPLLGASVGYSELTGRYARAPFSIFHDGSKTYTLTYIMVNATAALGTFIILHDRDFGFNIYGTTHLSRSLIAGTSAMAILRSSLMDVKINDRTFTIGFSPILQSILKAADRAIDRCQSEETLAELEKIDFTGFRYELMVNNLLLQCINTLESLSTEELTAIENSIARLNEKKGKVDELTLCKTLVLIISTYTGMKLITDIIKTNASSYKQKLVNENEPVTAAKLVDLKILQDRLIKEKTTPPTGENQQHQAPAN